MTSTHLCLPRLSRTVDWPPSLSRGSVEESRCALGWSRWLLGYTQSKYFTLGCTDRGGLPSTAEQNSNGRQLITGRRCRVVVVFSPRSLCFSVHVIAISYNTKKKISLSDTNMEELDRQNSQISHVRAEVAESSRKCRNCIGI